MRRERDRQDGLDVLAVREVVGERKERVERADPARGREQQRGERRLLRLGDRLLQRQDERHDALEAEGRGADEEEVALAVEHELDVGPDTCARDLRAREAEDHNEPEEDERIGDEVREREVLDVADPAERHLRGAAAAAVWRARREQAPRGRAVAVAEPE